MTTECSEVSFDFHPLGSRQITAQFDGGVIASDGGGLLLREIEKRTGIIRDFPACFHDYRDPELIEFSAEELLAQRIYGLCLGYEDLNDHDDLRRDPLLAVLVGRQDPTGEKRENPRDRGKPLAGKSTLNRLELTPPGASADSRYKKIVANHREIDACLVETFLNLRAETPEEIVIDVDATDSPLHGHQLGRFFHGYYDEYCYLPLYIFCGEDLLCAKLRPADIDGAAGVLKQIMRIVAHIRGRWPDVLRQEGLKDTSLSTARCDTLRLKLLKIGVQVKVSVRRVWFSFAQSYPYQTVFAQALANLRQWRPIAPREAPA